MLPSAANLPADLYHGLFRRETRGDGHSLLTRHESGPSKIPCPTTGRLLRVATVEAHAMAICPSCSTQGEGGFVSFEGDLRMAYACPACAQFVWLAGV
ncbi:MAG TPA: hypothetical protein VGJ29_09735 [Vicinamibacterales bacterium]|jgi:hypothetical protein